MSKVWKFLLKIIGESVVQSVDEIVQGIDKLPTISNVAFRVLQLSADKEIPIQKLVRVISGDQSLTAQILRVANSSYFNYPRTIYSLDRAIVILGFNLLRDIAVSLAVYSIYNGFRANNAFKLVDFWRHSLYTGLTLKTLAEEFDVQHKDMLYVGGLLHDLGKLVLVKEMNEDYYFLLETGRQEMRRLIDIENKFLGFDHAAVGARILEKWKLPQSICAMVEYHHSPDKYSASERMAPWVRLVYLGNLLAHLLEINEYNLANLIQLDPYFEKHFAYSDPEIRQMAETVEKEIREQQEYIKLFEIGNI